MIIQVVTLFPEMMAGVFETSIMKRAQDKALVELRLVPLRWFGVGPHRITDDYPFGGGVGMVLRPDVVVPAVEWAMMHHALPGKVVVTSAQGTPFGQKTAEAWSHCEHLIFVAGHYEGVDQRAIDLLRAEEVSVGDFVVTGGELPVMIMVDAVVRLLPGVLGARGGALEDSFSQDLDGLLEGPQYTRPQNYRNLEVPGVLVSGNHAKVADYKRNVRQEVTRSRRPDLLHDSDVHLLKKGGDTGGLH
ncbi:MAG: tRNA (guanosine(37)-N1)-methyltransferase TrmD [Firmicutes bacterium]|nr:tRNA (guanosine(37)-N1)-methyltransferase TrmD [Bacillota bacterium]